MAYMNPKCAVRCAHCDAELMRRLLRPYDGVKIQNFFCDRTCKGAWQRARKQWDAAWLRQKYCVEGLSANEIARIVDRDPKRVWEWIRDYGIETRPRGHVEALKFKPGAVSLWKGRMHSAEARAKISAATTGKPKHPKGEKHHWAGKTGRLHPSWKGGLTPERQEFYASEAWRAACKAVWKRADAKCERCALDSRNVPAKSRRFHIHHIVSFQVRELRAVVSNLVLLCAVCHRFIHGKSNTSKELLEDQWQSAA